MRIPCAPPASSPSFRRIYSSWKAQLFPYPHCGGAGDQHPPGEILPAENLRPVLHRLHPLFPVRGGFLRQGCPGPDSPAPVQQGGVGEVHPARRELYDELERLLHDAEEVLRESGLHYRVVVLCTGDMGFAAAKDLRHRGLAAGAESLPGNLVVQQLRGYQARRAAIRCRRPGAKGTELVHTLNGSGLAVGRTLVAILENYQQAGGGVVIPEKLRPYMGGMEKIG